MWLAATSDSQPLLLGRIGRCSSQLLGPVVASSHTRNSLTLGRCDVASAQETLSCDSGGRAIGVIIHAGGVLQDERLARQTAHHMRAVAAPKSAGLLNLQNAARAAPVTALVLFSSVASLIGSPGQANYAAANASLEASSAALHMAGIPGTSTARLPIHLHIVMCCEGQAAHGVQCVRTLDLPGSNNIVRVIDDVCTSVRSCDAGIALQWGAWKAIGMAATQPGLLARIERAGLGLISPVDGLLILQASLASAGRCQVCDHFWLE